MTFKILGLGLAGFLALGGPEKAHASVVEIRQQGLDFQFFRDGQPFTPKGAGVAGVGSSERFDALVAAGANAVRIYGGGQDILDRAHAAGLGVLLGISGDNLDLARQSVETHKDHPALLMWALGNEMERRTSDVSALWSNMETIAAMIKQVDGKHPCMTVVAEGGVSMLADMKRLAPSLDAVGINSYGPAGSLGTRVLAAGWDKPFFVTEFGPKGFWEVPKTAWNVLIEQTSTEKADMYLASYRSLAGHSGRCLGTFAFLWGPRQKKTHTWFGMFLPDGSPLDTVEAMAEAWTGKPAADKGPRIGPGKIKTGPGSGRQRRFQPGSTIKASLDVFDPDGPAPTVTWDLRVDVSDHPAGEGIPEPDSFPLPGAIVLAEGSIACIKMPAEAGNYRIFAYAKDAEGRAATANIPIQVR